jgi:hypothetical protein
MKYETVIRNLNIIIPPLLHIYMSPHLRCVITLTRQDIIVDFSLLFLSCFCLVSHNEERLMYHKTVILSESKKLYYIKENK